MNSAVLGVEKQVFFIHVKAIGQSMNALKALVIGMGALIVIGIGLVGYGLTRGKKENAPLPAVPVAVISGGEVSLALPRGARLEQMATTQDRIVLRLSGPEGDKLLLLDPHSGQLAGTVALVPDTH